MHIVYLSIGSNIGNRRKHLIAAMARLAERAGEIPVISSLHETEPWGFESANLFLNATLRLDTNLTPAALLEVMKGIENELGRTHKSEGTAYADRIVDIDMLLYDNMIIYSDKLTLPHPRMHLRTFVMRPLAEIAPRLRHPVFNRTMAELAAALDRRF
ncbi:MAG: 2-amino-4-hydroxy-6-hydroxymethyldihydropteridine diphosphokinase [Tannerella sp.]|jgi:2-amino-4-hydroxy-6-hydroxymethyldihydropteridine diphosphokinase|nr:2-amino-4-hydroxy-6-hydroxymethyldihydropteridine diphosphokinase [Tannerella sp.]